MDNICIYVFLGCIVVLFGFLLYDNMKCNHEWEQKTYSAIDYTSLNKVTKVCLVCKKCGKVKVLK